MFFSIARWDCFLKEYVRRVKSLSGYIKVILAHAALGIPFVIITVAATLGGALLATRAAANMGATRPVTFFRVQMPLIMPGVVSGRVVCVYHII
jgi:putative spermidine/putrescine transport system permease protein